MNWISGFEKHCVFTLDQIKQLISMAKEYGIEISADLAGHIGTEWPEAHLHFGYNRVHIAIAEEAIEWIKEILQ